MVACLLLVEQTLAHVLALSSPLLDMSKTKQKSRKTVLLLINFINNLNELSSINIYIPLNKVDIYMSFFKRSS